MLTLGSLFDGIGGWQVSGIKAGVKPVWSSEIEPFPLAVTKLRFPSTIQLGDITKIDGAKIQPVNIICMGSPCQDLSIAGKREGLDGERSGLFRDAIRIVRAMRNATGGIHPRFVIWENVPGAFSSNGGMDFRAVLEEYTETSIPMPKSGRWAAAGLVRSRRCDVAWRCLDAQYWGVPQRRNRIFLVVDFAETGRCAAEILFKSEGVCGDSASGEGTRQGFTGTTKEGVAGTGDSGGMETQGAVETDKKSTTPDEEIPPIVLKIRQPKVEGRGGAGAMWQENQSYTLATHQDQTLFQPNNPVDVLNDQGGGVLNVSKEKTGTLRAETHGHVPIIAEGFKGNQGTKARGIGYEKEKSPTLLAGQEPHVVMCFENHAQDARVRQVDVAPTLSAKAGMGGNNLPIVMESIPEKSFCIAGNTIERQIQNGGNGKGVLEEMSYTLNTTDRHAVAQPYGGGSESICNRERTGRSVKNEREGGRVKLYARPDSGHARMFTCSGGQIVGSLCAHDGRGFNGQDVNNDKLVVEEYETDYNS